MKIRQSQRDAFAAHAAETFPHRVQTVLVAELPARRAELEGDAGLARVRAALDEARTRGFAGERDACKWVALGYLLGEGFAEEPWAAAVLADPAHDTPTARVEALWATAEERALAVATAALTRAFSPEG
jgi:hypothetical protein